MKINREIFLNDLQMVKPGLSPREFIEQSSCFVFQDNMVMTFNDEISCRKKVDLDITGAIQAQSLLAILERMDDPDLMVEENDKGEVEFRGKRKAFGVTKDAEVFLPVDKVEKPQKWRNLPAGFLEAIGKVQHCASTDESKFLLTCIHLHPDYIEACDNKQLMRWTLKTEMDEPVLIRSSSLNPAVELGMDKIALTTSWVHFKNQAGLIYSCRRYTEDYHDFNKFIAFKGHPMVIPRGLADASERAAVFATDKAGDPFVKVTIKDRKIRIVGEGLTGWFREIKKVAYDGPPMEFVIAPELLKYISEKHKDAEVAKGKLKAVGECWVYCTVLGEPGEEDAKEE